MLSYAEPHKRVLRRDEAAALFRRLIYHPHGLITGSCLMTESQYESQSATLAFSLAIHAAFGSNLAIVGMSLDDVYLREQITCFRDEVESIFWFSSEFKEEPAKWAQANRVDMLHVEWPQFWKWWMQDRGFELDEEGMCAAWYRVLQEAWDEVQGGQGYLISGILAQLGGDMGELAAAEALGEPCQPVSDAVTELSDVVRHVGHRINAKGFPLPSVATYF